MLKTNNALCVTASFLLLILYGNALGAGVKSFEERYRLGGLAEENEPARSYIRDTMYRAIGPATANVMHDCLKPTGANTAPFKVVADLSGDGRFIHVAYEPKTDTAACFAAAMTSFQAPPPPPTQDGGPLPIAIYMTIAP
jgi:hypothetical protein